MNLDTLKNCIINNLSDDLLSKEWLAKKQKIICHKTFGHCYLATEAAYHILGGKRAGWKPYYLKCPDGSHWFLKNAAGYIFDVTDAQFEGEEILYSQAVGKGFLTKQPSKRAQKLIKRIQYAFK
jgi:hypothetical protein